MSYYSLHVKPVRIFHHRPVRKHMRQCTGNINRNLMKSGKKTRPLHGWVNTRDHFLYSGSKQVTRMADREKLDALSLLREGLRYEGTGASHVFVILGASVSVQTVARALTRTCILACKVCKSLHCACAVCTDNMFTMSDNVLSCNESKIFYAWAVH